MSTAADKPSFDIKSALNDPAIVRLRHWRTFKDHLVRHAMTIGGLSVIFAILLIFFYLLYVVFPLLTPASYEEVNTVTAPHPEMGKTVHLAVEEKNEIGVRFTDKAHAIFFNLEHGNIIKEQALTPENTEVSSFGYGDTAVASIVYGLSDGRAVIAKHAYDISYAKDKNDENVRTIAPSVEFPLGQEPLTVDEQGQALTHVDVQLTEEANMIAAITTDNRFILSGFVKEIDFLTEEETFTRIAGELNLADLGLGKVTHVLLDKEEKLAYLADAQGYIARINIQDKENPQFIEKRQVVTDGQTISAIEFLTGDISLLIASSDGTVAQWFPVRDAEGDKHLTKIREFKQHKGQQILSIAPEERRKGFLLADNSGQVGIYHSTAHRQLLVDSFTKPEEMQNIAVSPRADVVLIEQKDGNIQVWDIHNEHPEISFYALWGKVWYESHEKPKYLWQSSSASNDFEPKFSMMPLAFGTLKAAFYAMLVAVPIAIFGAIYAAYFMSSGMRKVVKPTIEIMEALPTVILGFLAGLWLAPVIEMNLPGVFMLLIMLPTVVLATAYIWWKFIPKPIKYKIPPGWEAALLIPSILFAGWLAFTLSYPVEVWLFNGDMRLWLGSIGLDFDQRNALVVGVAMGLAVIPSIFSITEDAVFSVPKHLTVGSLALGATLWQTMIKVVILTASPGIFSAVMIGIGRAVGETMIVLMATGNTPVMDFSIFQGLRTLSANIAVEMPESEVNSTHYRILFLSGLVLFVFTFFFNTLAEIVRHRLRRKYSSL
ncbi:phosphate ABC transporter permease [Candidatus Albibeggiatoa sp. nov. BB20]|uniref:phosphate ABC transporter permease n=1 Tax=Candidatus Albibeggiatoa sp. nov. BB20 TaxID=3162723 RepID=UPI0033657634